MREFLALCVYTGIYAFLVVFMRFWRRLCVFDTKNRQARRLLGAVLVDGGGG